MSTEKEIKCPTCKGKDVVKKGKQKLKNKVKQVFYCKDCKKRFVETPFKWKSYDGRVILWGISYYNLGHTLEKAARLVSKRFKENVSKSVVHNWLKEYSSIYTYHKIRNRVLKEYGKSVIVTGKKFKHRDQTFDFKFHKAKLQIYGKDYPTLIEYLRFEKGCPETFFKEDDRCSQIKITVKVKQQSSVNYACRLAGFVMKTVTDNKYRHKMLEDFMLINDTATVACEVPVWYYDKYLDVGVCGHIDILQIRYGKIYILDYKPEAKREKYASVQLYFYALGLAFRTKIPLSAFRCAWFNDSIYCEFDPSQVNIEGWGKYAYAVRGKNSKAVESGRRGRGFWKCMGRG